MFESLFAKKKLNPSKLRAFGFSDGGGAHRYGTVIQNGAFALTVRIDSDGTADTQLVDTETGEEYVLYKTAAAGAFVGEIRTEIERLLKNIADECFDPALFKQEQTNRIIDFVRRTWGGELEFLWKKFDDNAVWRRKDTNKWYAAVLTVQKKKLGLDSDELAEILDGSVPDTEIQQHIQESYALAVK
ncbi:hypothetical protein [Treponema brennaborense]|uniref:Uncharacterized protein n=1 Tax=Treponema brennaborense (strain DSM 12168 / CIP 105900 / DD5/3) TaxID=906968 RepID=F4LLW1_TREBD|nr:hypothetical protein [Treponema brennaborense]AEE15653.1 protein of unknown function DUF419 [Treponema brennaborense DSM 12168]